LTDAIIAVIQATIIVTREIGGAATKPEKLAQRRKGRQGKSIKRIQINSYRCELGVLAQ
jgi:hypothetical protein